MFASFFFEAVNFVGRLHSQVPIYLSSDVCNEIFSDNLKMGRIQEWLEFDADDYNSRASKYRAASQVSIIIGLLQTAKIWANAVVCGGLCACAVGASVRPAPFYKLPISAIAWGQLPLSSVHPLARQS